MHVVTKVDTCRRNLTLNFKLC